MKQETKRLLRNTVLLALVLLLVQTAGEWVLMYAKIQEFVRQVETGTVPDYGMRDAPFLAEGESWLGAPGDIPMTFEAINLPITILVGGHAGIVVDERRVVESSGLETWEQNYTKYWRNNWKTRYDVVLLLRVRDAAEEDYLRAAGVAETLVGRRYDFLFSFLENWIYCSQVPHVAWLASGVNMNYDRLWVTPNDLLVSPHTYIVYFHYTDSDGVRHTYY